MRRWSSYHRTRHCDPTPCRGERTFRPSASRMNQVSSTHARAMPGWLQRRGNGRGRDRGADFVHIVASKPRTATDAITAFHLTCRRIVDGIGRFADSANDQEVRGSSPFGRAKGPRIAGLCCATAGSSRLVGYRSVHIRSLHAAEARSSWRVESIRAAALLTELCGDPTRRDRVWCAVREVSVDPRVEHQLASRNRWIAMATQRGRARRRSCRTTVGQGPPHGERRVH